LVFENLKVKPLQRASSTWANALVDAIEQCYWLSKRGDPDTPFEELYGYYGYFFDNVFVQGKPVIKDGDPINIYDISDYVKTKISQSIDQTATAQNISTITQYSQNLSKLVSIEQYVREVREKVVQLRIDQYGNVGVVIAQPLDEYGRIPVSVEDAFRPVSVKGSLSASDNIYGFGISLFTGGRPNVNIYYKLSGAGNIYVKVSNDGVNWRTLDVISLTGADEKVKIYAGIAFQYVRVETDATGIDVSFEISASR